MVHELANRRRIAAEIKPGADANLEDCPSGAPVTRSRSAVVPDSNLDVESTLMESGRLLTSSCATHDR